MPFNSASDAFELHPDVRSYGTPLSGRRGGGRARSPRRSPRRDVVSNARARFSAYETPPPPAVVARPAPASALERVLARGVADGRDADAAAAAAANPRPLGAFYTLVPIRPRWRCGRRSLSTLPVASLRQPLAFIPRPRRLSTPLLTPFNSTPPFACIERPLFRRSLERRAATRSFVSRPRPRTPRRRRRSRRESLSIARRRRRRRPRASSSSTTTKSRRCPTTRDASAARR